MAVCREYHIPYGHFRGGPNQWTEDDRAKAIAYQLFMGEICKNCGTHPDDWKDESGRLLDEPMWTAVMRDCPGCEQKYDADREIPQSLKDRGGHTEWIPLDDYTPEDDERVELAREQAARQAQVIPAAPGLEG